MTESINNLSNAIDNLEVAIYCLVIAVIIKVAVSVYDLYIGLKPQEAQRLTMWGNHN